MFRAREVLYQWREYLQTPNYIMYVQSKGSPILVEGISLDSQLYYVCLEQGKSYISGGNISRLPTILCMFRAREVLYQWREYIKLPTILYKFRAREILYQQREYLQTHNYIIYVQSKGSPILVEGICQTPNCCLGVTVTIGKKIKPPNINLGSKYSVRSLYKKQQKDSDILFLLQKS